MSALLQGRGIVAGYGAVRVIDGVDLDARAGEVHGLIGPNGAGKSTLLRVLGALLPLRAGNVTVEGRELERIRPRDRAKLVAFLPQDTGIDAELSVRSVVALGCFVHLSRWEKLRGDLGRADARAVTDALERVGVAHLADRLITDLSGGQRQLVLIAKQLAQQSRILLLDEPVSALDLGYQLEVLELLRELAGDGHAVVTVLHDLNLAARSCDQLTVLADGKLRASGSPEQVLRAPLLDELYGIRSVVDTDPQTQAPRVTALQRRRNNPESAY